MDAKLAMLALASTVLSLVVGIAVVGYWTVPNPQLYVEGDGYFLAFDPAIGMVPRPSSYTKRTDGPTPNRGPLIYDIYTDERGARVDGRDRQRGPAQAEIVTLGCSFTWGHAIANRDTYAARLGRELGVVNANFAMAGFGTTQALQLLKRNRDLKPRLVIYGFIFAHLDRNVAGCAPSYHPFCLDVAHVSWDETGRPRIEPPLSNGVRRVQRQVTRDYLDPVTWAVHGVDVIVGRLVNAWYERKIPDHARREEAFAFLMREMERTVAEMGAELLVIHIPTKYEAAPPELARNLGKATRLLDLAEALNRHKDSGGAPLHIVDDGHPNPLGHELIAREIARYLREERLL
jgi:hypothetical protein